VLLHCLECIVQQESGEADIFVLDNSQDDPLAEVYCSRFPAVQFYKSEKNIGFAAGNNLLLQKTKGYEWIALVNPDAFLEPDWLKEMLSAADAYPEYSFLLLDLSCLQIIEFSMEKAMRCICPGWPGGEVTVSGFLRKQVNLMRYFPPVRQRRFIGVVFLNRWAGLMRIFFAISRM